MFSVSNRGKCLKSPDSWFFLRDHWQKIAFLSKRCSLELTFPEIGHSLIVIAILLTKLRLYLCSLSEALTHGVLAKSEVSLGRDLCICAKLCFLCVCFFFYKRVTR